MESSEVNIGNTTSSNIRRVAVTPSHLTVDEADIIPWWNVDLGRDAPQAAYDAVSSRRLSQGPVTEQIERQLSTLVKSKFAIATSSGSTAITLALMAAGAQPGDIVICPAYTWVATAHAARILGCTIETVDIERDRPVMDVELVPPAKKGRCFAIPVHMNGHVSNINSLKDKGYTVIEDAAQALGSKFGDRHLGTLGDAGCYSFSVSKIVGSGQGGLIVTNSRELAMAARRMRTHGVTDVFAPERWELLGHNFRYNDVLAAVLQTQIPLLETRLRHIKAMFEEYRKGLHNIKGLSLVHHHSQSEIGPYIEARVSMENRDRLIKLLTSAGVGARSAFPTLNSASYLGMSKKASTPNADAWSAEVLYLPSGPAITARQVERVVDCLKQHLSQLD